MTGIPKQLKWESIKKRRKGYQLVLPLQELKGKGRTPIHDLVS